MKAENPIVQFQEWLADAKASSMREPTAMALATSTSDGKPSTRVVLLKAFDDRGFVFYTNSKSRKGREMAQNPNVALLFYWMELQKQVRVEGVIGKVSDAESDAYFAGRHRESQIGAWASEQSNVLESREVLLEKITKLQLQYEGKPVPRPPHWHGYRVEPSAIEFWQEEDFRIHQRRRYTKTADGWDVVLLNP